MMVCKGSAVEKSLETVHRCCVLGGGGGGGGGGQPYQPPPPLGTPLLPNPLQWIILPFNFIAPAADSVVRLQ